MCDYDTLYKENNKVHAEIREVIKKQGDEISDIKKDMATKTDIMELKPKVTSANTLSTGYKVLISVLLSLLLMVGGFSTYFIVRSEKANTERANEQIKMNKILNAINDNIKESNSVAKNFNAKAIMDTISIHWRAEQDFYHNEYKKWTKWTKGVYDSEIHKNTLENKKQEVLLHDHELRIEKLEKAKSIIK